MANYNYISTNGLVTQDLEDIIDKLTSSFKDIYGNDVNLEQNTADGQWLNILAQEKKDILDLITTIYNNLDVDSVIGLPQQVLYKLNGLKIKAYTYSYCYVNVTVAKPITLQGLDDDIESESGTGFTISDSAGNNWILVETTPITNAGTYLLNFRAEKLGNVQALPNTINVMNTILAGVSTVNNPANNYVTGNVGETASEFRTRRHKTMAIASQGFEESIESQLLNITNVTQAKVYSNRKSTTQDGIPPHTIWTIVEGGSSEDIGRVIYNNIPPGIGMKGSQNAQITKVNGTYDTVNYDFPNAVPVYIMADIKTISDVVIVESNVKEQLAKTTFDIGEAIQSSKITEALKNIVDETGNPYDVEVSLDGISYEKYIEPTGLSDYFVITPENINLTVV